MFRVWFFFQRQEIKEELAFARFSFQSVDEHPEWNSPKTPVFHDGFNLMELTAGSDVANFGRRLGLKLFSSEERDRIVSPQRVSESVRAPVSKELGEKFKSEHVF